MEVTIGRHTIHVDERAWDEVHTVEFSTKGVCYSGKPSAVTWRVVQKPHTCYVVNTIRGVFELRLHRLLMNAKRGQVIDHINGNGLDNRLDNLRFATAEQNSLNRRPSAGSTSKFIGVGYHKAANKWESHVRHKRKKIHLGLFPTEEAAAKARDEWVRKHRPEFGYVNDVE